MTRQDDAHLLDRFNHRLAAIEPEVPSPPRWRGTVATGFPRWTVHSMFSATRFVVAVVAALFGGYLLIAQPFDRVADSVPGAEGLPPVTGPAGNGLIAFSHDGDIVVGDAVSGESQVIVAGERGFGPLFSPDGTHIAFLRLLGHSPEDSCDIVVVRADGSEEHVITPKGDGVGCISAFAWAPDSGAVMVTGYEGEWPLMLLDASGLADPVVLPIDDVGYGTASVVRPPDGDRLIVWGGTPALGVLELDGGDVVDLGVSSGLANMGYGAFDDPGWSPDGSRIAVLARTGHEVNLYVMQADGSHLRHLAAIPWHERWSYSPSWSWSPDGSTIAVQVGNVVEYSRESCPGETGGDPCYETTWVTLIDVETGEERVLEATNSPGMGDGALIAWTWSPDGQAVLLQREYRADPELVDIVTDTSTELPWGSDGLPLPSWQRVAAD